MQVLRYVRRNVRRAAGLDEVAGIVALVAALRDAAAAGQARCDYREGGRSACPLAGST